jgi:hypothetical protein
MPLPRAVENRLAFPVPSVNRLSVPSKMNQPLLVILVMSVCAFWNCPVFETKRILPVLVLLISPVAVLTRFALILSVP